MRLVCILVLGCYSIVVFRDGRVLLTQLRTRSVGYGKRSKAS